ncbi:MAG: hypothetical protein LBC49_04925 [Bacteroidales bacterium]|jgi:hypothetical protein|nr:hypothetical protein [Bacteroidales bacterium]
MEFTKEQIEKYKRQYGSVFMYTSKDGKSCILRAPDLQILDACRTISGGSSIRFDIALVDNCWIDGDIELKTIDKYKMGLFDWLGGIIQKIDGELKEL